ncbi:hypothetical protein GCM10010435_21750 [Winogradskya consettensis]|uniref:Uncharacterized protein n=1 Tax=Winogradskya consettensis TaxID=113560 RepID=A0A919VKR6_9ACTN|nr:hypothetical protein [Actinoplanes consettensis]GIM66677.1 hypothetical protein Aco04nite_02960 [Actinoplanes consettensis]
MSTLVPPLFAGLVDDASVLPPGVVTVADAVDAHRKHLAAWYAPMIGALLVPASQAAFEVSPRGLSVAVVNDGPIGALPPAVAKLRASGAVVGQVEALVARRGEDPQPGLVALREFAAGENDLDVYAEIPLSWGLLAALDTLASAQPGPAIRPKFRIGGLAAELFPTPVELAAVICACRDRDLRFKLAAGMRHALRHTDPETGFTHHGFLNVLVAAALAVDGGEVADVAEVLAATHPVPLVEPARARRAQQRPLCVGFGTVNVLEPLTELVRLGLVNGGYE